MHYSSETTGWRSRATVVGRPQVTISRRSPEASQVHETCTYDGQLSGCECSCGPGLPGGVVAAWAIAAVVSARCRVSRACRAGHRHQRGDDLYAWSLADVRAALIGHGGTVGQSGRGRPEQHGGEGHRRQDRAVLESRHGGHSSWDVATNGSADQSWAAGEPVTTTIWTDCPDATTSSRRPASVGPHEMGRRVRIPHQGRWADEVAPRLLSLAGGSTAPAAGRDVQRSTIGEGIR